MKYQCNIENIYKWWCYIAHTPQSEQNGINVMFQLRKRWRNVIIKLNVRLFVFEWLLFSCLENKFVSLVSTIKNVAFYAHIYKAMSVCEPYCSRLQHEKCYIQCSYGITYKSQFAIFLVHNVRVSHRCARLLLFIFPKTEKIIERPQHWL